MKSVCQSVQELSESIIDTNLKAKAVNLRSALRDRLLTEGHTSYRADEIASEWAGRLSKEINERLQEWDLLGIPRPLIQGSSASTFLTFKNPSYEKYSGKKGLPTDFPEILEFIRTLSTREFLIVPACLLFIAKCDPIFITEGANDGGIDCMGKLSHSPMRSLCIFMQSKAGPTLPKISTNTIRQEFAKFQDFQNSTQFINYLTALDTMYSVDGQAFCYAIVSNSEFDKAACNHARKKQVLLRSCRQAAFWISQSFRAEHLVQLRNELEPFLSRDLRRNIAPIILESFN